MLLFAPGISWLHFVSSGIQGRGPGGSDPPLPYGPGQARRVEAYTDNENAKEIFSSSCSSDAQSYDLTRSTFAHPVKLRWWFWHLVVTVQYHWLMSFGYTGSARHITSYHLESGLNFVKLTSSVCTYAAPCTRKELIAFEVLSSRVSTVDRKTRHSVTSISCISLILSLVEQ